MKILVCTDFAAAAAPAEREASARFPAAELVVFHATDPRLVQRVVDATGLDGAELRQSMLHHADVRMNEVIERLVSQGRRAVPELVEGEPVEMALAAAARHAVELVLVGGAPGGRASGFRAGLVRAARCRVLYVPDET